MRRVLAAVATGALVLAACGGGSSPSVTTIGGCKIQSHTSCPGANLSGADLRGVTLDHSNLSRVAFEGADLSASNLSSSNLESSVLTNTALDRANLANATLNLANFTGADLTDATLRGATTTPNANLFTATIRCRTVMPNGTIDNTSCSFPLPTSTTTTTAKKQPTTTTRKKPVVPTTRPSPPTTRPTPPTTGPTPPPACSVTLLQAAYVAQFGPPPEGTTFSVTSCAGGYAGTNLANPDTGPAFAVYQVQGSSWVALNVGTSGVCGPPLTIPPQIQQQIGCI